MNNELIKTKQGYFSIKNMPTQEELEKYYQDESVQYAHEYSADELKYFDNIAKTALYIYEKNANKAEKKLLEVGAGEGFFANSFFQNGWSIRTLDYSEEGIMRHNPHLLNTLVKGDIFQSLDNLIVKNNKYNLINLSNVLEHVIDPIVLLQKFKLLLSDNAMLRISVPNDYSDFQNFLLEKNYTSNTWLSPPDHLHYFTFKSLTNLLESEGYEVTLSIGEFPIELFLSNKASNYVHNKENGKFAHKSRIEVDNFLFTNGIENYINFYKASASIGLSRQIIMYVKVRN